MINESKHKKLEENYTKSPHNQIAQTSDKEKKHKISNKEKQLPYQQRK